MAMECLQDLELPFRRHLVACKHVLHVAVVDDHLAAREPAVVSRWMSIDPASAVRRGEYILVTIKDDTLDKRIVSQGVGIVTNTQRKEKKLAQINYSLTWAFFHLNRKELCVQGRQIEMADQGTRDEIACTGHEGRVTARQAEEVDVWIIVAWQGPRRSLRTVLNTTW